MFFKRKCNIAVVNPNKIKGKIIIGYCPAQETFIAFIRLKVLKISIKDFYLGNFHTNYGKRV